MGNNQVNKTQDTQLIKFIHWDKLDDNIQTMVIKYLNYLELTNNRLVNKKWKMLIDKYLSIIPSARIYYQLVNVYSEEKDIQKRYFSPTATNLLIDYCLTHSYEISPSVFDKWDAVNIYALKTKLHYCVNFTDVYFEPMKREVTFYRFVLKILKVLQEKFTRQFINERVKLFNELYNLKIHPQSLPFRIIEDISVYDNNKLNRIKLRYSTDWNRVDYVVCGDNDEEILNFNGSEDYSEDEMSDHETNNKNTTKWNIPLEIRGKSERENLAEKWEDADTEEIITDWDNKFDEWNLLISIPGPELLKFFEDHPLLCSQMFPLNASGYIFRYIIYKTQKFLDLHKQHWTTFPYLSYDIDKLCFSKKSLHIDSSYLLEPFPLSNVCKL